jgi:hypothetical protein
MTGTMANTRRVTQLVVVVASSLVKESHTRCYHRSRTRRIYIFHRIILFLEEYKAAQFLHLAKYFGQGISICAT